MKRSILLIAAAGLTLTSVNAKSKKPEKTVAAVVVQEPVKVLTNEVDSMSYAFGLNVGADFSKSLKGIPGGKSNIDLIIKGFVTALKGDSALMKMDAATSFFRNYITREQTKELEARKTANQKFLIDNKTAEGVQTTASGLQYKVLTLKDGLKPKATDSVTVHYQGFLVDGTKFDSSLDRGEPVTFPLNQVIPGWTEGVQLMSVGSKYKFFIPYNLGYGENGYGNGAIPGFATLIFEVELLSIKPAVEAPAVDVKAKKAVAPQKAAIKPKVTSKTKK